MISCELCDAPATVTIGIRDIDPAGGELDYKEHVYCENHARSFGGLLDTETKSLQAFLLFLRLMIRFIKENQRMPRLEELSGMGAVGNPVRQGEANGDLAKKLAFLENMVEFIEKNGRSPSSDELPPDPF
jgi:hypothetical protein